jgi:hypothetical protein
VRIAQPQHALPDPDAELQKTLEVDDCVAMSRRRVSLCAQQPTNVVTRLSGPSPLELPRDGPADRVCCRQDLVAGSGRAGRLCLPRRSTSACRTVRLRYRPLRRS